MAYTYKLVVKTANSMVMAMWVSSDGTWPTPPEWGTLVDYTGDPAWSYVSRYVIGGTWTGTEVTPRPYPWPEYEVAAQDILNAEALSWGYDSSIAVVSYIGDPYPQYAYEANLFRAWRSAMWVIIVAMEAQVFVPPPTLEQFLAALPPPPSRANVMG